MSPIPKQEQQKWQKYEHNFRRICRYCNLVKYQRMVLYIAKTNIHKLIQHDNPVQKKSLKTSKG
jgi:hypothetical protein